MLNKLDYKRNTILILCLILILVIGIRIFTVNAYFSRDEIDIGS